MNYPYILSNYFLFHVLFFLFFHYNSKRLLKHLSLNRTGKNYLKEKENDEGNILGFTRISVMLIYLLKHHVICFHEREVKVFKNNRQVNEQLKFV